MLSHITENLISHLFLILFFSNKVVFYQDFFLMCLHLHELKMETVLHKQILYKNL